MKLLRRLLGSSTRPLSGFGTGLVSAERRLEELRRHVSQAERMRIEWARELVGAGESVWQIGGGARWFSLAAAIMAGARGAVLSVVAELEEATHLRSDAKRLGAFDARLDVKWARLGRHERKPGTPEPGSKASRTGGTEVVTLDRLLADHRAPTLLRIDCPDALEPGLAGGERLFEGNRPVLLLEFSARPDPDAWDRLRRLGYEMFDAECNPADRLRLDAPARHTLAIPK